jgi:hypothetical protein
LSKALAIWTIGRMVENFVKQRTERVHRPLDLLARFNKRGRRIVVSVIRCQIEADSPHSPLVPFTFQSLPSWFPPTKKTNDIFRLQSSTNGDEHSQGALHPPGRAGLSSRLRPRGWSPSPNLPRDPPPCKDRLRSIMAINTLKFFKPCQRRNRWYSRIVKKGREQAGARRKKC